jgi:hypothetical protein
MITRRVVFALLLPHHRRGAGRHAVKRDYAGALLSRLLRARASHTPERTVNAGVSGLVVAQHL